VRIAQAYEVRAVAELAGVPDDEQAKPAPDPDPGIAGGNTPASTILTWRG
jgi:hypothetical protein